MNPDVWHLAFEKSVNVTPSRTGDRTCEFQMPRCKLFERSRRTLKRKLVRFSAVLNQIHDILSEFWIIAFLRNCDVWMVSLVNDDLLIFLKRFPWDIPRKFDSFKPWGTLMLWLPPGSVAPHRSDDSFIPNGTVVEADSIWRFSLRSAAWKNRCPQI